MAVVTPTLDGDVLAVLAQVEAAFTPGQAARLIPDASVEGIRKVLRRLAAQGIVVSERAGQAYTYRLNRDHLAAEHIVALAHQRATLLLRLEQLLTDWAVAPVYGALFGSAARGSMRPDSDIDVFLVRPDVDDVIWEAQTGDLASTVTRWTGNDTRLLDLTEVEVRAGVLSSDPILQSIADDGLTIAGRPTWMRTHLRAATVAR